MSPRFTITVVAFAAVCACSPGTKKLKARASFDMDCPISRLHFTKLGGRNTQGVLGCGRQATYIRYGGPWVLNAVSEEDRDRRRGGTREGSLPPGDIREVVRENEHEISRCYRTARRKRGVLLAAVG